MTEKFISLSDHEPVRLLTVQQRIGIMFQRSAGSGVAIAVVLWLYLWLSGALSEMTMLQPQFICWLLASVLTVMTILFWLVGFLLRMVVLMFRRKL
jgi:hypothetical protein